MITRKIQRRSVTSIPDSLSEFDPIIQRLYASRNVCSPEQVDYSLTHLLDFRLLSNIELGAQVIADIIEQQKSLLIVGDFDADGATSTALLLLALRAMGARKIDYCVPNRFDFGYGLSVGIVEKIAQDVSITEKPDWIITVDNGISNIDGVARAKELGMKVMITDHHLPPEQLPDADVIVNPNLQNDEFPSKALAGVGVAFYLLIAARVELRKRNYFEQNNIKEPNLAQWLDLVALGTVADVVPLDDNNRKLVAQGIQRIRQGLCRPAISLLLQLANREQTTLQASDLGFAVGPRLNAAGRLDDMSIGIESLIANSAEAAKNLVVELDNLNRYRREREAEMVEQAMSAMQQVISELNDERPPALCLFNEDWHQGIVGLVASRVKEKVNRPVFAFAQEDEEFVKGSGRSINGIHMRDMLANIATKHPNLIEKFGGHAMAAGLSLKQSNLATFEQLLYQEAQHWLEREKIADLIVTDGVLEPHHFNCQLAQSIADAGPWGQHFPEPLFDGHFEVISQRIVGEKHLKLVLRPKDKVNSQLVDAIYFFVSEELLRATLTEVEVVYKLSINTFRGQRNIQLIIDQLADLSREG